MSAKLLQFLDDEFARMDVDYQARKKARDDWHRIFRGKLDKKQENLNKSRLVINRTKVAVMHGVANIVDIIFANSDFFDVVGRTKYDQQGAATIKKLSSWLIDKCDFLEEATRYILQAAIYGTAFGKIVKHSTIEVSVDRTPILNMLRKIIGREKHFLSKTITYPAFETVDNDDMWLDPTGLTIDRLSGLFQRFRRTINYMKAQKAYENVEQLEKAGDTRPVTEKRRQNVGLPTVKPMEGELEFYEYWGKVPADKFEGTKLQPAEGETEVECIITWHKETKTLLRVERNLFPGQMRMFVKDVWEPSGDKDLYGRGIPENVRGPQMALNATVNLRLDNKAWAIAHPIAVDTSGLEDESDLLARVNWIIRCTRRPQDVVQAIPIPDITAGSMQEEHDFERIIDDESGINRTVQASQSFGSNRTAQGISIAFSAASRPVRLIARGFERNLITKGLKALYTMLLMDMDEPMVVRITDDPTAPQFLQVDPLSLSLDIDFVPKGTFALASREAVAQNITQFAQAIGGLPPEVVARINWAYLVKKFYEALFGATDWDQVWIGGEAGAQAQAVGGVGGQGTEGEATGANILDLLGRSGAIPGQEGGVGEEPFS